MIIFDNRGGGCPAALMHESFVYLLNNMDTSKQQLVCIKTDFVQTTPTQGGLLYIKYIFSDITPRAVAYGNLMKVTTLPRNCDRPTSTSILKIVIHVSSFNNPQVITNTNNYPQI